MKLLQTFADYGVTIIIISAFIMFIFWICNALKLSSQKNDIKKMLEQNPKQYNLNGTLKTMEEKDDESVSITPDNIRQYETEFNKTCSVHSVLIQIIPIFPLLGILGTVAGLMLQIQEAETSLNFALETTFWGLVCAIIFKLLDAIFSSRIIYDVEVMLDDFYKKIDIAEMFENLNRK